MQELCSRLSNARRIMVVGNGGIALELLNEIHYNNEKKDIVNELNKWIKTSIFQKNTE